MRYLRNAFLMVGAALCGCTSGRTHLIEQAHVNPVSFNGFSYEITIGAVYRGRGSPCAVLRSGYYTQYHYIYLKENPDLPPSQTLRLEAKDICVTTHRFNSVSQVKHLVGYLEIKDEILTISFENHTVPSAGESSQPFPYDLNGAFVVKCPKKEF